MKLVSYRRADGPIRAAALLPCESRILDLHAASAGQAGGAWPGFASTRAMIEAGAEASLGRAADLLARPPEGAILPLSDVRLMAPVPRPAQMRDALCFEKHLVQAFQAARKVRAAASPDPAAAMAEMERLNLLSVPQTFYEQPIYYKANRFSVIGPETDVLWPAYSEVMDFELEFGIFIGREGCDIAADEADRHIFGYTIFNDFSARDAQMREMGGQLGPAKGKDFDTGNAMGPWLVTADEIPDPYDLTMIARVNGEEWGRGNSGSMHWKFGDVLAHVSAGETLHPGEFIGSGTVGNGCGLEQMRFLQHGDVVELEVSGLGVLRNRVLRRDRL